MTTQLLSPILENGIKHVHFFHGRLLSAEDLRDEQEAHRRHHRQLGRAIGAGVAEGLEVVSLPVDPESGSPRVEVKAGVAINAKGQTLELPQNEQLQLVRTLGAVEGEAGLFDDCEPPVTTQIPNGLGLYVLVMSPASGFSELAPKSGLDTGGKAVGCGNRYEVEGVRFRLEQLKPLELSTLSDATRELLRDELLLQTDAASVSKLRNVVAHLAYGTEELAGFPGEPFPPASGTSPYTTYGALDELRELGCLDDCDVPLAVLYWTREGMLFLDLWSVRRRPFELSPSAAWPTPLWARRLAEAEATLLQFQQQLDEVIDDHANPSSIVAGEYFRYLPAAGFLPVSLGAGRDVDFETFLAPLPFRRSEFYGHPEFSGYPEFVDGHLLPSIFDHAWRHKPVDLAEAEMIWLYQPAAVGPSPDEPRVRAPHMVFASCHLPPFGTARFDVARWDFSNYVGQGVSPE